VTVLRRTNGLKDGRPVADDRSSRLPRTTFVGRPAAAACRARDADHGPGGRKRRSRPPAPRSGRMAQRLHCSPRRRNS